MTCPEIRFIYGPPAYDTGDNVPSGVRGGAGECGLG